MCLEIDDPRRRRVDEAVVGGDDHSGVQAGGALQESAEGAVQPLQQPKRMATIDAMLMRDGVVVGIVSIDVAALVGEAQAVQRRFEELLERGVPAQLRSFAMRPVVHTGKDALGRDRVRANRKTLKERSMVEKLLGRDAERSQRSIAHARS